MTTVVAPRAPGLSQALGIETDYMIVDATTLDVRPWCDRLFVAAGSEGSSEVLPDGPEGPVAWCRSLAQHVVTLRSNGSPAGTEEMSPAFGRSVARIEGLLAPMGCRLLPTGMHPWMDPQGEGRMWEGGRSGAYEHVFGGRVHGWCNAQSTRLRLGFEGDEGFGRLHAALRVVLPLVPALAASSPIVDGEWTPVASHRMKAWMAATATVPQLAGLVVPEPVYTREAYERLITGPMYGQLLTLDPGGALAHPWANARGAVPLFDEGIIEVRVIDVQECPQADMAIAALIRATVGLIAEERWMPLAELQRLSIDPLHNVMLETIRYAEHTRIHEHGLLEALGIQRSMMWARDVWLKLVDDALPAHPEWTPLLRRILEQGTLASRISQRVRRFPTRPELHAVYSELAGCLRDGILFGVA